MRANTETSRSSARAGASTTMSIINLSACKDSTECLDYEEDYYEEDYYDYDHANNRSNFFKPSVVVDQPVVSQYKCHHYHFISLDYNI